MSLGDIIPRSLISCAVDPRGTKSLNCHQTDKGELGERSDVCLLNLINKNVFFSFIKCKFLLVNTFFEKE